MKKQSIKTLKERYMKEGYKKAIKEAALWIEDKDDAIGLPDGEYLYNTFLEGMDSLVSSYKNLERRIKEYENMDEDEVFPMELVRAKKDIAKAYAEVRMKITELND